MSSLVVIALAPDPELVWLSVCATVAALFRYGAKGSSTASALDSHPKSKAGSR